MLFVHHSGLLHVPKFNNHFIHTVGDLLQTLHQGLNLLAVLIHQVGQRFQVRWHPAQNLIFFKILGD